MMWTRAIREHVHLVAYVLRWIAIAVPVSVVIGSGCALFLWLLDWATNTRAERPWLLYLLPVAGVGIVLAYRAFGRGSEAGNNLIMDEIHDPKSGVPARMGPMILIATVVTHLFGGSAGREGTAVQIGGSLAATYGRWLRLDPADIRRLLMVGIAAGFGGVFGTPLAAAVFAMEVIAIGRISYEAIFPCLVAGIVGDYSCTWWGIRHTHYEMAVGALAFEWSVAGKVALAAVGFGLASVLFAELTHGMTAMWKRVFPIDWMRPITGGLVVIGLVWVVGTRDYLGLGVVATEPGGVSIVSSFQAGGAETWSWFWKIVFTAVTLSCGFKGGEVTPLFFIGATLGHTLALVMGAPVELFAAIGFIAVFAGATNTPLACTLMGIELFGSGHVVYFAIGCFVAYLFSGHSGVYLSQRVGTPKVLVHDIAADSPLRTVRQGRGGGS